MSAVAVIFPLIYLFFSFLVAGLLRERKGGFYLMFFLCLIFTPLLVGILGIILTRKTSST